VLCCDFVVKVLSVRTRVAISSAQIMLQTPVAVDLGIVSMEVSALVLSSIAQFIVLLSMILKM